MKKKGFTLVEVMVATIIIGISAGIAIPSYRNTVEKTWKGKATHTLACIWAAEKRYYIDEGTYTNLLDKLDVEIPADELKYYEYSIDPEKTTTTDFEAKAEKKATKNKTGGYYFTVNAAGVIEEFKTLGGPPVIVGAAEPPPKK